LTDDIGAGSAVAAGFPTGRLAFLATSNLHKFHEARGLLREYGIATAMLRKLAPVEIQDDNLENIASTSAIDAVSKCNLPLIVEDAGLFIPALRDFPGPYSSYVYRTVGNDGILQLLEDATDRTAYFRSVVAFFSPRRKKPVCFRGQIEGEITAEKRGHQGFGFDPIFQPVTSSHTFAEMTLEEKNACSHRSCAFRSFAEWYVGDL
jgi:XTP/dITP diphosphohydrolase